MSRFIQDKRGAGNPIEFILILPLLLLLLFGIYEIWRIVSIKESLDRGLLQAAEYWSTCPPTPSPQPYKYTAEQIVRRELAHNPLIGSQAGVDLTIEYYDAQTGVQIWDPTWLVRPFEPFIITARLAVPWEIKLPLLGSRRMIIGSKHVAFKEKPYWVLPPTPTPTRAR